MIAVPDFRRRWNGLHRIPEVTCHFFSSWSLDFFSWRLSRGIFLCVFLEKDLTKWYFWVMPKDGEKLGRTSMDFRKDMMNVVCGSSMCVCFFFCGVKAEWFLDHQQEQSTINWFRVDCFSSINSKGNHDAKQIGAVSRFFFYSHGFIPHQKHEHFVYMDLLLAIQYLISQIVKIL